MLVGPACCCWSRGDAFTAFSPPIPANERYFHTQRPPGRMDTENTGAAVVLYVCNCNWAERNRTPWGGERPLLLLQPRYPPPSLSPSPSSSLTLPQSQTSAGTSGTVRVSSQFGSNPSRSAVSLPPCQDPVHSQKDLPCSTHHVERMAAFPNN